MTYTPSKGKPCTQTHKLTAFKVEVTVKKATSTLMDDNEYEAKITPSSLKGTNHKFEIARQGKAWALLQDGAAAKCADKERISGKLQVRVTSTIKGIKCESKEEKFTVDFPTIASTIAEAAVSKKITAMWTKTKNDLTVSMRREWGFYIQIDTKDGSYSFVNDCPGNWVANNKGASWDCAPLKRPADVPANPQPGKGKHAKYTIGWAHSHTSMEHRGKGANGIAPGSTRVVGPSAADSNYAKHPVIDCPGIAYDYVAKSMGRIPVGHPTNSAAKSYIIPGISKRSTK